MGSDIEYIIEKVCKRRGVAVVEVENVAFNVAIAFGLADNTPLLPVVANTFYLVRVLEVVLWNSTGTPALLVATNSGQGSAGIINISIAGQRRFEGMEFDSMLYKINSHASGTTYLFGEVFSVLTV